MTPDGPDSGPVQFGHRSVMVYYDNSFERDDDIGPLSAMSTIGSWRRKGLTILLSAILLLLAVFVVLVLFNNMDSDANTEN